MAEPRTKVLISAPYLIPNFEKFRPVFHAVGIELTVADVVERLSSSQLLSFAGQVDAVICGDDEFSAEVLEAFAPRLKVISKWGTGIDSIDLESARRLGVVVRNTPDAFVEPVSDSVIGYVLCFARGLPAMDQSIKAGTWRKTPGWALHEQTLGVVGVGRIGRRVVEKAACFGMKLLGNDVVEIEPDFVRKHGLEMTTLHDLLARADYVSLNCDLNASSYHLADEAALAKMKQSAVLINTARGRIVDEQALIAALRANRLHGAALDVFEEEPLPADSPLREFDQVMLAPHNSNASPAAWARVHRTTIRHLLEELHLSIPDELISPEARNELVL